MEGIMKITLIYGPYRCKFEVDLTELIPALPELIEKTECEVPTEKLSDQILFFLIDTAIAAFLIQQKCAYTNIDYTVIDISLENGIELDRYGVFLLECDTPPKNIKFDIYDFKYEVELETYSLCLPGIFKAIIQMSPLAGLEHIQQIISSSPISELLYKTYQSDPISQYLCIVGEAFYLHLSPFIISHESSIQLAQKFLESRRLKLFNNDIKLVSLQDDRPDPTSYKIKKEVQP